MCLIFFSFSASATVYQVGSSRPHESPNALYLAAVLQDNDTIEIDAETYIGQASLAVWLNNNLVIKGVGGQPQLIAAGEYIWGKGIWVAAGNNITIENISFSGASVPSNILNSITMDLAMDLVTMYISDISISSPSDTIIPIMLLLGII